MFGFGQEGRGVADSIVVVCVASLAIDSTIVVVVVTDADPTVVAVVVAARITCLKIERLPTPRTEDNDGPSLSCLTSSGPWFMSSTWTGKEGRVVTERVQRRGALVVGWRQ